MNYPDESDLQLDDRGFPVNEPSYEPYDERSCDE